MDSRGSWTAELRMQNGGDGWKLLIEPGPHAHSLRVISSYDEWCKWLAPRIVSHLRRVPPSAPLM
jgi:hypothetical protein